MLKPQWTSFAYYPFAIAILRSSKPSASSAQQTQTQTNTITMILYKHACPASVRVPQFNLFSFSLAWLCLLHCVNTEKRLKPAGHLQAREREIANSSWVFPCFFVSFFYSLVLATIFSTFLCFVYTLLLPLLTQAPFYFSKTTLLCFLTLCELTGE